MFLTSYAGEVKNLPIKVFNDILNLIEKGSIKVPIAKIYHGLSEIGQAQENLESGNYIDKHVVIL